MKLKGHSKLQTVLVHKVFKLFKMWRLERQ